MLLTTLWSAVVAAPQLLDMPPRCMWGWEPKVSGYCGSVSVQTAAIYHGNWLSEDAIRGTSGGHNAKHQLLVVYPKDAEVKGAAISSACESLKLNCSMWDYDTEKAPQHAGFLGWAKDHVDAGHPVIMGLYWGVESDADYDHIVPLVGYDTDDAGADGSNAVSAVYFNDLHGNATIRAEARSFVASRKECNKNQRFGPGSFCLPQKYNYGIAVRGNQDAEGVLLPVRLAMDSWTEPDYSVEDQQHEAPVVMGATVTVSGLTAGMRYALLRFDNPAAVPARAFLAAAYANKTEFVASGATWTERAQFESNSTTLFRCVQVAAATARHHHGITNTSRELPAALLLWHSHLDKQSRTLDETNKARPK